MAFAALPFRGTLLGQATRGCPRNRWNELAEVPAPTLPKAHLFPLSLVRERSGGMGQILCGPLRSRRIKRIRLCFRSESCKRSVYLKMHEYAG